MALSVDTLKGLIVAQVTAQCGATHLEASELEKFALAIATAVVTHITSAGVVHVVTACSTGAGTGTGTVS